MLTEMGGGMIVKLKLSVLVESATEAAVMVGDAFAPEVAALGGVYEAEKLGAALCVKVPQAGAQGPAVLVSVHVTPTGGLEGSLLTVAVRLVAPAPSVCELN